MDNSAVVTGQSSRIRRLMTSLLAVALAAAFFSGAAPARADTGSNNIGHVWLNVSAAAGQTAASQYTTFLQSLRSAAGHGFRNGVMQTQGPSNSLIRADFTVPDTNGDRHTVLLWLTPDNLYVRGFTAEDGTTWQFSDTDYSLQNDMVALQGSPDAGLLPSNTVASPLLFGSNYNSMTQAAGRGRESMRIGYADLLGSLLNLATTTPGNINRQSVARSLMFMIQWTSEAARFWDVYGVMNDVMTNDAVYNGLPLRQQYLENNWDAITQYALNVTQNPAQVPFMIPMGSAGEITFSSFGDVQARMGTIIGDTSEVSSTGDWSHTEL